MVRVGKHYPRHVSGVINVGGVGGEGVRVCVWVRDGPLEDTSLRRPHTLLETTQSF